MTTTVPTPAIRTATLDVSALRRHFPILATVHNHQPLAYLDNGATTQKPQSVIDAIARFYQGSNANIHRGVYHLSQHATTLYEQARENVRAFINAAEPAEVLFTRGTTESINLVAQSWGRANLTAGDTVVVSHLEHHSNIVPWQMLCAATGARLEVIPINDAGELQLAALDRVLDTGRVRLVAINHVSNSLGTVNPVREIIQKAHAKSAIVLVDGAQWVAHGSTDVQALDADFYAFSGHKMFGPTGVGVLYGKRKLLDAMPPWQGGGDMIESVSFAKTTYAALPNKFEAGTPNIAGAIGLAAAVDFIRTLDFAATSAHEHDLLAYATEKIRTVPGVRILGTAKEKVSVLSFVMDQSPLATPLATLDIGVALDKSNIAVRTGHHCCQPVMDFFHVPATVRASFAFYNTREEVDRLITALQKISDDAQARPAALPQTNTKDAPIAYPAATANCVRAAAEKLAEEFAFMEDAGGREAKSEFVLDAAKTLPRHFDLLSKVTPCIPGCMSQVYLVGREKPNAPGTFEFVADADAEIVRGLIALLEQLYSGQKAAEVAAFDIESFFNKIGLDQFITSQRRNGLAGMVHKIRTLAQEIAS